MSDRSAAISLVDVSVRYRSQPAARSILGRRSERQFMNDVVAVQGVSFSIDHGDVVGLVGYNGAGKSTLLRVIAGLQRPSTGSVTVSHDPVLLGVGSVMNGNLSGRQNALLGMTALGLTVDEARQALDDVFAFAGVSDAIHRPLRTYSSGMKARLQFAIATVVRPQLLLVDELLAVGDRRFRRKSFARIADLASADSTVVIVSHNTGKLRKLCNRAIWIDGGIVRGDGDAAEVIRDYEDGGDDSNVAGAG